MLDLETLLGTPWLLYLSVILVSLCVGSFLNVVILRLPKMMHQDWRCQCEEFLEVPEKQRKQEGPRHSGLGKYSGGQLVDASG